MQQKYKFLSLGVLIVAIIGVFVFSVVHGKGDKSSSTADSSQAALTVVTDDSSAAASDAPSEAASSSAAETSSAAAVSAPDESSAAQSQAQAELSQPDESSRADESSEAAKKEYKQYKFRSKKLYDSHYQKHGSEFGSITQEEYLKLANDLLNSDSDTVLHKTEKEDGDEVYFDTDTGYFLVLSTDGYIRTFFIPDKGIDYYNKQ